MAGDLESGGRQAHRWRICGWSALAGLLLLPWLVMQFADGGGWDAGDFVIFGALLLGVGISFELAARASSSAAYRAAVGVALAAALILIWGNLALGVIGSEDNAANLMYAGVLAVGIIGALLARGRPQAMARALLATALAQALVAVIALQAGPAPPAGGAREVVLINAFFIALFVGSAWLFRKAAREAADMRRA